MPPARRGVGPRPPRSGLPGLHLRSASAAARVHRLHRRQRGTRAWLSCHGLMELRLPVRRYATSRSGGGLVQWVMHWWWETWPIDVIVRSVVIEPRLTWLEA